MGILDPINTGNPENPEETFEQFIQDKFVTAMPIPPGLKVSVIKQITANFETLGEAIGKAVAEAVELTLTHIKDNAVVTGTVADVPLDDGSIT